LNDTVDEGLGLIENNSTTAWQPIFDHPSAIPIAGTVITLIFVIGFWLGAQRSKESRRELEQLRKELNDEKEKNSKERNERERE